ncbi:hypothetical protein DBZ36_15965 [Alginatibacterium sediminis]|uniref:Uncharacterized protein n=1 Tax=Alginatibacterium sediminis TaxID=2164068 RepID=A0A420E8V6_9ALTE|nr:hypothetical protein [Alginatibacterium sediminis]RKF15865.1 hypothetical protein DBZ36_15965 [Alginatibacterium sediminis]
MKTIIPVVTLMLVMSSSLAHAGKIVVQKSSDPDLVDVFALKRELVADLQWQEYRRQQQALNWVYSLPIGCVIGPGHNAVYQCGLQWYRPYRHQGQEIFVEVDSPRP